MGLARFIYQSSYQFVGIKIVYRVWVSKLQIVNSLSFSFLLSRCLKFWAKRKENVWWEKIFNSAKVCFEVFFMIVKSAIFVLNNFCHFELLICHQPLRDGWHLRLFRLSTAVVFQLVIFVERKLVYEKWKFCSSLVIFSTFSKLSCALSTAWPYSLGNVPDLSICRQIRRYVF